MFRDVTHSLKGEEEGEKPKPWSWVTSAWGLYPVAEGDWWLSSSMLRCRFGPLTPTQAFDESAEDSFLRMKDSVHCGCVGEVKHQFPQARFHRCAPVHLLHESVFVDNRDEPGVLLRDGSESTLQTVIKDCKFEGMNLQCLQQCMILVVGPFYFRL